jgi:hypothetical protein
MPPPNPTVLYPNSLREAWLATAFHGGSAPDIDDARQTRLRKADVAAEDQSPTLDAVIDVA